MAILDSDSRLISDLWLDQPDAHDRVDQRHDRGLLTAEEAEQLHGFTDDGYIRLTLDLPDGFCEQFQDEVDAIWDSPPSGAPIGLPFQKGRISLVDAPDDARQCFYRLAGLHSFSTTARQLYVEEQITRWVGLILDETPVAFQSLYFERGSQQGLHRDPMFVKTTPRTHLVAAWTALEDIEAGAGELMYVPGSHRMPWFEFSPDEISVGAMPEPVKAAWNEHTQTHMAAMGLEVRNFRCSAGDVFVWHGNLLHGGAKVTTPGATRRSFVAHYSSARNYTEREATLRRRSTDGDDWTAETRSTSELIDVDGRLGLEHPFAD